MKYLIVIIVVIMLLFIGCATKQYECPNGDVVEDITTCNINGELDETSSESTTQQQEQSTTPAETTISETNNGNQLTDSLVEEPITKTIGIPQLSLTQTQKDKLNELLNNKKSIIYPPMLGVNDQLPIGGTYTFAYGIKNPTVLSKEFFYSIKLIDSKTESLSNAGADDTVLDWFLPNTDLDATYTLGKNEIVYVPLIVVIGDKMNKDGKKTVDGTYDFRVTSETIDGVFTDDHHYTDFVIRVSND